MGVWIRSRGKTSRAGGQDSKDDWHTYFSDQEHVVQGIGVISGGRRGPDPHSLEWRTDPPP